MRELCTLLTDFYEVVSEDARIRPTHISLYLALLEAWSRSPVAGPLMIRRADVMKKAKFSARGTYHRCMKDLHDYGYIRYEPSCRASRGSVVYLKRL